MHELKKGSTLGRKPGGSFFPFLSKYFSEWYVLKMEVGLGHPFFHHIISIERSRSDIITDILVTSGDTISVVETPEEIINMIEAVL